MTPNRAHNFKVAEVSFDMFYIACSITSAKFLDVEVTVVTGVMFIALS